MSTDNILSANLKKAADDIGENMKMDEFETLRDLPSAIIDENFKRKTEENVEKMKESLFKTMLISDTGKKTHNPLKKLVSQNKRRYHQNGFDLDLSYITERIIAMGLPADGFATIYRNTRSDVIEFFRKFHTGHYKVYNLCVSKSGQYPTNAFENCKLLTLIPMNFAAMITIHSYL